MKAIITIAIALTTLSASAQCNNKELADVRYVIDNYTAFRKQVKANQGKYYSEDSSYVDSRLVYFCSTTDPLTLPEFYKCKRYKNKVGDVPYTYQTRKCKEFLITCFEASGCPGIYRYTFYKL
jgi:hypothetical protein